MLGEMAHALRSRRNERSIAVGLLFGFDGSKSSIHLLLLRLNKRGCGKSGRESEEFAAHFIACFITPRSIYSPLFGRGAGGEAYCSMLASIYTIHTCHTTAIVDAVVLGVDTRCLAFL